MKKMYLMSLAFALLVACATIGAPPPKTFNEKVAVAITTVTSVRTTASNLLVAKKITVDDAKRIQEQADNARAAIDVARDVYATDPGTAENRINSALTLLNSLATYLQSKQ